MNIQVIFSLQSAEFIAGDSPLSTPTVQGQFNTHRAAKEEISPVLQQHKV